MMKSLMECGWLIVLAGLVAVVCGQQSCRTHDGKPGRCVSIQQCPQLQAVLRQTQSGGGGPDAFNLLRRSICRLMNGRPFVCCVQTKRQVRPSTTPIELPSPQPNPGNGASLLPKDCGVTALIDRIVNGKDAPLLAWPWLVLLRIRLEPDLDSSFACGGTLISDRYVLTAAHCIRFTTGDAKIEFVRIGEHTLSRNPDCEITICALTPQDIPVEEVIVHEGYDPRSRECRDCNDIALLRLSQPARLHPLHVIPLCLPGDLRRDLGIVNRDYTNRTGWVAGWGITESAPDSSKFADVLQEANLPIGFQFCDISRYPNPNMVVCAGGSERKDTCRGDSGGPIVVNNKGNTRSYILGIVSSGPRVCGAAKSQGIYTSVNFYLNWIFSKLRP